MADGQGDIPRMKQNMVQRMMSFIIPRAQIARMTGTYDPLGRDIYQAFGYPNAVSLASMLQRYERGGIARRIVDAYPDATWGAPPIIVSDNPEFDAAWEKMTNDFDIWTILHRLDVLSQLGEYAVLLIGVTGPGATRMDSKLSRARELLYLQPYSQLSIDIQEYDNDVSSPRFQKPVKYDIKPKENRSSRMGYQTPTAAPRTSNMTVHYSRTVHVAQRVLEDDVFGLPALLDVWNYLIDLEKVGGAAAENFWISANRGLHLDVDKEMDIDPDDEDAINQEVDEYQANLRRVIRTKGIKVNVLGGETVDPKGAADLILDLISGTKGIPRRVLLGTESGHLASTQDKGNWAERVEEYRLLTASPQILDPFIWAMVDIGLLPDPGSYYYMWPDAHRLGPNERGVQAAQTSRTAANLARMQKDWQSLVIQRKQLAKTPEPTVQPPPPAPVAGPAAKGPFGMKPKPKTNEERTPMEDDLAHEASGQQGGGKSGGGGSGKPMQQTVNPTQIPVTLPELPDMLLSVEEIRRIIGLSTDGRVLDQKVQVVKGKKKTRQVGPT